MARPEPHEFPIDRIRLDGIIAFLQAAEQLKDTLRSGRTAQGRAESTAEHSWRLCLLAMMFERELIGIDVSRLLRLLIVHDLGEAIAGDIPAVDQHRHPGRAERERADLLSLCSPLPSDLRDTVMDLWDDYSNAGTPEAVLAKGFDKIETMLQHLIGSNAPGFDYRFNLSYGKAQTDKHPLLREVRRAVDEQTRERIEHLDCARDRAR